MGKLLSFIKSAAPAQRQPARKIQGQMVDVEIVGESFHQDYIRRIARRVGGGEFEIILRPEPSNPYDKNAIAVLVDGAVVGHLSKTMAKAWQPMLLAAEGEGFACAGTASIYGGTKDKPSLGVFGAAPWPGHGTPPDRWH
jgi:hypothetical protein